MHNSSTLGEILVLGFTHVNFYLPGCVIRENYYDVTLHGTCLCIHWWPVNYH